MTRLQVWIIGLSVVTVLGGAAGVDAAVIEDVYETKETAGMSDVGTMRLMRFGAPLHPSTDIPNLVSVPANVQLQACDDANICTAIPADVFSLTARPNGKPWWVGIVAPISFQQAGQLKQFKVRYGIGAQPVAPATPLTVSETSSTITVNTGPGGAVAVVKKVGFNLIDALTVNGVPILAAGASPGLRVVSSTGTIYTSAQCAAGAQVSVLESGAAHAVITFRTPVCSSTGVALQHPTIPANQLEASGELQFLVGSPEVQVNFHLENQGPALNGVEAGHLRLREASLVLELDPTTFGVPGDPKVFETEFLQTPYTTERVTAIHDRVAGPYDQQLLDTDSSIPNLHPDDPYRNSYARIIKDGAVIYDVGDKMLGQTGSRAVDGFMTVSRTNAAGTIAQMTMAIRELWMETPITQEAKDNTLILGLRPAAPASGDLISPHLHHNFGPLAHCPGGAACGVYNEWNPPGGYGTASTTYPPDTVNYVMRSGSQTSWRFALRPAVGPSSALAGLNSQFGKRVQATPLAALPTYDDGRDLYRRNKAFIDPEMSLPKQNWSALAGGDLLLQKALEQLDKFHQATFDQAAVTHNSGGTHPWRTLWNRSFLGNVSSTAYRPPMTGYLQHSHPWDEGHHHTAYGDPQVAALGILRAPSTQAVPALQKFLGLFDQATVETPFNWKTPSNAGAGGMGYEKGPHAYAIYSVVNGGKGSERHKTLMGQAAIAMTIADRMMIQAVKRNVVNMVQGYPYSTSCTNCTVPGSANNYYSDYTPKIGRGIINTAAAYQATGDVEYVTRMKQHADAIATKMNTCYQTTGVPLALSTLTNGTACTFTNSVTTQWFMEAYTLTGMLYALEAHREVTGQDDPALRDTLLLAIDWIYTHVFPVNPYVLSNPMNTSNTGYGSWAINIDGFWNVFAPGVTPSCTTGTAHTVALTVPSGQPSPYTMSTCNQSAGPNTAFAPELLAWAYHETGNQNYLDTARVFALNSLLFLTGNGSVNLSSPTALANALGKITYVYGPLGAADTKVMLQMLFRMNRYFLTELDLLDPATPGVPPATETILPTAAMTAPSNNATVSATVTVSATASDNVGVVGVQFLLDGANLGAEDMTSPYSISWDTMQTTNGSHTVSARARDAAGNFGYASGVPVTVSNAGAGGDTQAPTVALITTLPDGVAAGATVSGMIPVSANASDNVGVTKVEFRVDGTMIAQDLAAPFTTVWTTTLATPGSHALSAKAYDAANNSAVSASVPVTVSNSPVIQLDGAPTNDCTGTAPKLGFIGTGQGGTPGTIVLSGTPGASALLQFSDSMAPAGQLFNGVMLLLSQTSTAWVYSLPVLNSLGHTAFTFTTPGGPYVNQQFWTQGFSQNPAACSAQPNSGSKAMGFIIQP